jgi:hypothetical protein
MRWAFALWLVALPILVAGLFLMAAMEGDANARFHATNGAIFIAGLLVLPWVIGLLVLGWLAFRRRR